MIIPLPLVGLALASTIPMQKKNARLLQPRKIIKIKRYTRPVYKKSTIPFTFSLQNSLSSLMKGLSTTVSRITLNRPSEDYDAVVKSFLPAGASLLAPQYPVNVGKYLLADLDGDMNKELVASYRLDNTNTTLVLKKYDGKWSKVTEAVNSKYNSINFLNTLNIEGDIREQLLIGWKTKEGHGELLGYSLHDGKLSEVFTHKYSYLELLDASNGKSPSSRAQLALWNRKGTDAYDIEVKRWNGTELQSDDNYTQYYHSRVLPYYGKRVKKMPYNPSNWYYLAEALEKAGLYQDGLTAVDMGMRLNPVSPSLEEFVKLKEEISKKL